MHGPPAMTRFHLSDVPTTERRAALHDVISPMVNVRFAELGADFDMGGDVLALPGVTLLHGFNGSARVRPLDKGLAAEEFVLAWTLKPWLGQSTQFGRVVDGRERVAVLGTLNDEFETEIHSDFWPIAVRIARSDLIAVAPRAEDALGRRVPWGSLPFSLLRSYMMTLRRNGPPDTFSGAATIAGHIRDLVALTIGVTGDCANLSENRGLATARLAAAKQFIAEHLTDRALSIGAAAAAQGVSPRYLQQLFDRDGGTFSEYVRDQRLALAHRMLANPLLAAHKVSTIAFDAGFGDLSYFNRSFRARFGEAPSDVRARGGAGANGA